MESGDRAELGWRRRRVLLLGRSDRRLRPHQPERHRVHRLRRRADPPDRRALRRRGRRRHRGLIPRGRAGLPRALPGHRRRGHHRARGHHPNRPLRIHLSEQHPVQRPFQGGRRDQHDRLLRRARGGRRRAHGRGNGRTVLRDGYQLHALLRGEVRPGLRRTWDLGRFRGLRRLERLRGCGLRRVGHLRYHLEPGRSHEGGDLLRQHDRRPRQPRTRGSRVVTPQSRDRCAGPMEFPPRKDPGRRRHPYRTEDLLHRALPLAALSERDERRFR